MKRIIAGNKRASKPVIKKLCRDEMRKSPDLEDAIFEFWFEFNYGNLTTMGKTGRRDAPAAVAHRAELRTAILHEAVRDVPTLVLDLPMPNGKKLGECTFREVGLLGAAFKKLASHGKPTQLVNAVLTNTQVKKILKA
jgi:hypothetical protein